MARKRFIIDLNLKASSLQIEAVVRDYINVKHFSYKQSKTGEMYYEYYDALMGYRGLKYSFPSDRVLHLETWAGKYGHEMDISDGSFIGAMAKSGYYDEIKSLINVIENTGSSLDTYNFGNNPSEINAGNPNNLNGMNAGTPNNPNGMNAGTPFSYVNTQNDVNNGMNNGFANNGVNNNVNNGFANNGVNNNVNNGFANNGYYNGGQSSQPFGYSNGSIPNAAVSSMASIEDKKASRCAIWSFIVSLLFLILSCIGFIMGVPVTILLIYLISRGMQSSKKGFSIAAIVIGAISVAIMVLNVILTVMD